MATKYNMNNGYAKSTANSYLSGGQQSKVNPANTTFVSDPGDTSKGVNTGAVVAGIQGAAQLAALGYEDYQGYKTVKDFDVEEALPEQNYNPYFQPPSYIEQQVPDEISKGTGGRAMMKNAISYGSTAASIGSMFGPLGTGIGLVAGIGAGLATGAVRGVQAKKQREKFEAEQNDRYNEFLTANQRYYDVLGTQTRARAAAQSIAKRGQNVTPYYDATIYGFM